MALGALALVPLLASAGGAVVNGGASASDPTFFDEVTIVGDASYPTGGSIGLDTVFQAIDVAHSGRTILGIVAVDCFGYVPGWDSTNKKLKFYWCAGAGAPMTEVTNATVLSGVTFKLLLISR